MSAPARAGIFIYAKDPDRLSGFYQSVLGMVAAHRTDQMIVLRSPDLQLIVHAMPPQVASQVVIASPPQLRDSAAIKFFCTIPSLSGAQESAQALGGQVLPEQWQGPGFVVRNACDPEGNIFQVRESAT
ncbi:VOC family protein [Novilysobacter luteus]|uniref:VOC family protein n=1 Tax=Novilysobacter luteus TaxID=2822368 RepID=UPI001BFC4B70|nr:VOC family protein [Lysobacter luteus]